MCSCSLSKSKMGLQKLLVTSFRFQHTWLKPEGCNTNIKVYNCITKQKEPFIVRDTNATTWYTCGPTVYDSPHIGHASSYVKLDIIQRFLRKYFNINLITAMNITDIDDKIIKRSIELRVSPREIAQKYEKEFWHDLQALNVPKPNLVLRVTDNIRVIESFIDKLEGHTTKSSDGSIVFDLSKKDSVYGKLQNIGEQADKSNFTLWKRAKEHEPYWDSKFGPGRPGWHTECSAIASAVFGSTIDVHAGGIDLRFPHHENEEIQSCAHFSKSQWVNYWLHTGHLLEKSTKMSKSLKNTINIENMLKLCSADTFRMMCLMSHYRNNMEFTPDYIKAAETNLDNYKNFVNNCNMCFTGQIKPSINNDILNLSLMESIRTIDEALRDDFNTSACIKSINGLIKTTNVMLHSTSNTNSDVGNLLGVVQILNFVTDTFNMFGIDVNTKLTSTIDSGVVDKLLDILTDFRQNVRILGIKNQDKQLLELCDHVREDLKKCDVIIQDIRKV